MSKSKKQSFRKKLINLRKIVQGGFKYKKRIRFFRLRFPLEHIPASLQQLPGSRVLFKWSHYTWLPAYDTIGFCSENLDYYAFEMPNSKRKWDIQAKWQVRDDLSDQDAVLAQRCILVWPNSLWIRPHGASVRNLMLGVSLLVKKWVVGPPGFGAKYNWRKHGYSPCCKVIGVIMGMGNVGPAYTRLRHKRLGVLLSQFPLDRGLLASSSLLRNCYAALRGTSFFLGSRRDRKVRRFALSCVGGGLGPVIEKKNAHKKCIYRIFRKNKWDKWKKWKKGKKGKTWKKWKKKEKKKNKGKKGKRKKRKRFKRIKYYLRYQWAIEKAYRICMKGKALGHRIRQFHFFRLYGLYFFWFLYLLGKMLCYINKIMFNYWLRFLHYALGSVSAKNSQYFFNHHLLYREVSANYSYAGLENTLTLFLRKVLASSHVSGNLRVFRAMGVSYYTKHLNSLFLRCFEANNIGSGFYNYDYMLGFLCKGKWTSKNLFFDFTYSRNYKIKKSRKIGFNWVAKKIDRKYRAYFKINYYKRRFLGPKKFESYVKMVTKRNKTLYLK